MARLATLASLVLPALALPAQALTLAGASVAAAPSLDLEACFQAALKRSETVAIQTELLDQAEERWHQAVGSILPNLSVQGSYLWQQTPTNAAGSSFFPSTQPLVKLVGAQPLFQGFREYAALRQTREQVGAQELARRQAAVQLYKDTASGFYNLAMLEQDLENVRTELALYETWIKELEQRIHIGRSRVSERLNVESAMAGLRAQGEQLAGQIGAAREVLVFLTGIDRPFAIADREQVPEILDAAPVYAARAGSRPDVRSAEKNLAAAEEGIAIARGGHFPSVNLLGDYYLKRTGVLQDVKWDVQIAATMPIFSGGVVQSQLRQAESQQRQADLAASQAKRAAQQDIRASYDTMVADRSQYRALVDATGTNERNFKEQTREYRLGLVTNLDVLQALASFQESKRARDRALATMKMDYAKLEAAAARRPSLADGH